MFVGRILEFLVYKEVSFERCTFFVIDEADRMIDAGFVRFLFSVFHESDVVILVRYRSVLSCLKSCHGK